MEIIKQHTLNIDYETFSFQDISLGVSKYTSESELLLMAYSFDGEAVKVIDIAQGEEIPPEIVDAFFDKYVTKKAWNASFEIEQSERYFGADMILPQWQCTMVKAARCGYPLSLEGSAIAIGMPDGKDSEGKDLIKTFCIPRKPTKTNPAIRIYPADAPEKWEAFKRYNKQDVVVEMAADSFFDRYPAQPEFEHKMYVLDRQINKRGVELDIPFIEKAIELDSEYKAILTEEAKDLTGLQNPNSLTQLKDWLEEHTGILWKGLDKEVLRYAIDESIAPYVTRTTYEEGSPKYNAFMAKPVNVKKYSKPGVEKPKEITLIEQHEKNIPFKKTPIVEQMLELRKELSNTSVAKYVKMLEANIDSRIYDTIQFNGAGRTGRNAGRIIQPQNMPRIVMSNKELDTARRLVSEGDLNLINMCYDSVSSTLSQLIRAALVAKDGHMLKVADLSAIEARVLAWLAGEEHVLEVFRTHGKIYEATAAMMFKVPLESITKGSEMRQRGKTASLACVAGDQLISVLWGGIKRLDELREDDAIWDGEDYVSHGGLIERGWRETVTHQGFEATPDHLVKTAVTGTWVTLQEAIDSNFDIVKVDYLNDPHAGYKGKALVYDVLNCGPRNQFVAGGVIAHNCGYQGAVGAISKMDSDRKIPDEDKPGLVKAWRAAHPKIVKYWYKVQESAIRAIQNPGEKVPLTKGMYFIMHKDALLLYLPSGRYLMYPKAHLGEGQYGAEIRFMGQDQTSGKWLRMSTYGGSLVENATQAIARDVLMEGMYNLVRAGYDIVFSVHDEIVTEMPEDKGSLEEIEQLMCVMPAWADGLPLAAEGFESKYYKK